ncbi:MAG: transcription termination factor Rho [Clostridiales bacterium]|nr:transcription termination factor Rho [Clostridiales bacterium]
MTRADLEAKKVAELKEMALELGLEVKELRKKDDLICAVLEAKVKAEGFVEISGILDVLPEGYGFIRTSGYLPGDTDVYCSMSQIRRGELRRGDLIKGQVRPPKESEKYPALQRIDMINGRSPEEVRGRKNFRDLTPVYPDERFRLEIGRGDLTARIIDLIAPIGKGQRGLIVSPPKAGKTTILKDIAASITANNPEVYLMCLLVDERPEEVTDMERSIHGEVVSSTFDMPSENHIAVAELLMERAKRLVESGFDVVILLDSITRLARAYNLATPASGRILSGGVDSTALYPPKRFFGAARNIEHGGSLTILATALVETGSKMDEVIFEEFKGTGNMELRLDRRMADRRIFPAIDVVTSGTRKEELLLDPMEAPFVWGLRRILHGVDNAERAIDMLIKGLRQTESNQEFLSKMAKKAQEKTNGIDL